MDHRSPSAEVHTSAEAFRAFARHSRDGIIIIDDSGAILEWNEGEEAITGIPRSEAMSRPIWELQHRLAPDEHKTADFLRVAREKVLAGLAAGAELSRVFEEEIQRPDGARRIMQSTLFGILSDGRVLAGAICRDVTDRRHLEEDLRERQAMLLEAEQLVHLGHWDRDLRTGRSFWSDEVHRILGYEPGALSPSPEAFRAAVAPEDRDRIGEALSATARDGCTRSAEYRVVTAKGDVRYLSGMVELLRDADGTPVRLFGTVQDITERKRVENEVRESEARLSLAIAASGHALWDWDVPADRAVLSPEYLRLIGHEQGDVRGARAFFRDIVHPDDLPMVEETMGAHLQGRSVRSVIEYRTRRSSGEYFWVQGVGQVMGRDERGSPLRMIGFIADITERKRAEEALRASEARNRAMIAAMPDLLFRVDEELRFLDFAADDPARLAAPPERFLGLTIPEVFGEGSLRGTSTEPESFVRGVTTAIRRALQTGEVQHYEYVLNQLWFEARITRIGLDQALVIARDVTALKRAEKALRAAVQSRESLLAAVSHDLRSPLSSIELSANLLSRRAPEVGQSHAGNKRVDVILRSVKTMKRLIDDLLQAATIESGTFTVEKAREEVLPIIEEAIHAFEPLAAAKSARLSREVPPGIPPVWCDRQRVLQVLSNLIGNAVKFVSEGGSTRVRAWPGDGEVHFAVSDDGPGIAEDHLPHLFERYWQGREKGRQGVGLGLFIAKGIVEAHDGRLWVESRVGAGSTFCFTVPIARAPLSREGEARAAGS